MSEPAGIVLPFAGSVAPQGYLLCDGSAVSRDTYSALFAAIGTTYGAGDGVSTFNVPDLSGRVVLGVSNNHTLGTTGGETAHTLTEQELPAHSHTVPAHGHANDIAATTPELTHTISTQPMCQYLSPNWAGRIGNGSTWVFHSTSTSTAERSTDMSVANHDTANCTKSGGVGTCAARNTTSVGSGNGHNNMQPYTVTSYIICTGL